MYTPVHGIVSASRSEKLTHYELAWELRCTTNTTSSFYTYLDKYVGWNDAIFLVDQMWDLGT